MKMGCRSIVLSPQFLSYSAGGHLSKCPLSSLLRSSKVPHGQMSHLSAPPDASVQSSLVWCEEIKGKIWGDLPPTSGTHCAIRVDDSVSASRGDQRSRPRATSRLNGNQMKLVVHQLCDLRSVT